MSSSWSGQSQPAWSRLPVAAIDAETNPGIGRAGEGIAVGFDRVWSRPLDGRSSRAGCVARRSPGRRSGCPSGDHQKPVARSISSWAMNSARPCVIPSPGALGELGFLAGGQVEHEQLVVADEGDFGAVARELGIDLGDGLSVIRSSGSIAALEVEVALESG